MENIKILSKIDIVKLALFGLEKKLDDCDIRAKICRNYDLRRFEYLSYDFKEYLEDYEELFNNIRNDLDFEFVECYLETITYYNEKFNEIWR